MTWDQLVPVPIESLAVLLLVAAYVLPTGIAAAVLLWRDGSYGLGAAAYGVSVLGCINALATYAYTPNLIDSRSRSGSFHDAVLVGQWWTFYHLFIDCVVAALFLAVAVLLLKRRHFLIGWQCLATVGTLAVAGLTYVHYDRVLLAWLHNRVPPQPFSVWVVIGLTVATGSLSLVALYFALRDVVIAIAFKLLTSNWQWPGKWWFNIITIDGTLTRRSDDLVQCYMQQQVRGPGGDPLPTPYAVKRWRQQQRHWGGRLWWRYSMLPVLLYCAQFNAPPLPPDYRYYELHEFYP